MHDRLSVKVREYRSTSGAGGLGALGTAACSIWPVGGTLALNAATSKTQLRGQAGPQLGSSLILPK